MVEKQIGIMNKCAKCGYTDYSGHFVQDWNIEMIIDEDSKEKLEEEVTIWLKCPKCNNEEEFTLRKKG